VIENFFELYAVWPWNSHFVKDRAIYLETHDSEAEEEIFENALIQATPHLLPILSPRAPFKTILSLITISCVNKIVNEIKKARQLIHLARAYEQDGVNWERFMLETTILNESEFFLMMKVTEKPSNESNPVIRNYKH